MYEDIDQYANIVRLAVHLEKSFNLNASAFYHVEI